MRKWFTLITLFCLLAIMNEPVQAMNKTDRQQVNALFDRYAQAYQTANVEELTNLFADRASIGGRQYNRSEIRSLYSGHFSNRKQNLRSVSVIDRGNFQQTPTGDYSGVIKLRSNYGIGDTPKMHAVDTEISFTLRRIVPAARLVPNEHFVIVSSNSHELN